MSNVSCKNTTSVVWYSILKSDALTSSLFHKNVYSMQSKINIAVVVKTEIFVLVILESADFCR